MSGHTPGPWISCQLGRGVLVGPSIGGKVGNVAVVYGGYGETAANVALIESAPDLLKSGTGALHALRSLLAMRDGITDEVLQAVAASLEAAIKNARGA